MLGGGNNKGDWGVAVLEKRLMWAWKPGECWVSNILRWTWSSPVTTGNMELLAAFDDSNVNKLVKLKVRWLPVKEWMNKIIFYAFINCTCMFQARLIHEFLLDLLQILKHLTCPILLSGSRDCSKLINAFPKQRCHTKKQSKRAAVGFHYSIGLSLY